MFIDNSAKTNWKFIGIVVILAVLISTVTLILLMQKEIDTSTWLTYRNEEFGFELKYPEGWHVNDSIKQDSSTWIWIAKAHSRLLLLVREGTIEAEQQLTGVLGFEQGDAFISATSVEEIDGVKGERLIIQESGPMKAGVVVFTSNNLSFLFMGWGESGGYERRDIANQILSTFRFVEKDDETTTRETYEIPGYGTFLDITLAVNAPFSDAKLTIYGTDGYVSYIAKKNFENEFIDSGYANEQQVKTLVGLIERNNFFSIQNLPPSPGDPTDGSIYKITIGTLSGDPELADRAAYTISCYQFNCTQEFLEIKEEITKIWDKKVLEIGI